MANAQHTSAAMHMKNSFNFVAEEQENEDMGSDGREDHALKRPTGVEHPPVDDTLSNNGPPKSKRTHAKKQSAIKSYGDIANQLLTSPKNAAAAENGTQ